MTDTSNPGSPDSFDSFDTFGSPVPERQAYNPSPMGTPVMGSPGLEPWRPELGTGRSPDPVRIRPGREESRAVSQSQRARLRSPSGRRMAPGNRPRAFPPTRARQESRCWCPESRKPPQPRSPSGRRMALGNRPRRVPPTRARQESRCWYPESCKPPQPRSQWG
jgi:hypothetical protein